MTLVALSPREASIFACLTDAVVAPVAPLPAVALTDAVVAFDALLAASPPLNRRALRLMLLGLELAPRAFGAPGRLRQLDAEGRTAVLLRIDAHPLAGAALKALRSLAHLSYYGDDAVMRSLGYDADGVVGRAAALRVAEGRW